ncbi:short-chain dehydrogenase/reductase [Paraburkholderia ginsengiterrae]|uniref:Short-chain dehydrogenase/reductase n=1 Tax=Paraburkholderia ginsengiterrae TaxID=1462993 RepID=A0A1A9N3T3_9BURK|nr:oxidoreductase [Paraburkholderia ginsengiterrae]OAJ56820.1 short-chain dehydrogenase/reductase [Paraburkholderia ginsengiterrae]OAJ56897.1 short-chain dehydrogenase/reductase [Paraburkholderia ginsengiterrae]
MIRKNAVWLITGCSKGLGRALAQQALESGYRVVLSARDVSTLEDIVTAHGDAAAAVEVDVTRPDQVTAAVAAAEARFGGVDVLVNNAGYGYLAAIEEGEDADVKAMFDANVFGTWHMIKAVLPGMRKRKRGHVVNISSVGGLTTFPAVGFYHMTKFAVEGLSETLAKEIAPFGLGVTVVEPGAFRTDFRGASLKQSNVRLPVYADTAGKARDSVFAAHGKQQGDPVLGSKAIITAVESDRPPLHLVIGGDALDLIRKKIGDLQRDLDEWEEITRSTNFVDPRTV